MKPQTIHSLSFSPTATSAKIARVISEGIHSLSPQSGIRHIDATFRSRELSFSHEEVVVVAVPVYGGHIAPKAVERLQKLRGEATPAVAVVVYGNRAFDQAAVELVQFLDERGFRCVAVGAFVGEHSYSTVRTPIAEGRPNLNDLEDAKRFGMNVYAKLAKDDVSKVDLTGFKNPPTPLWSMLRFVSFILRLRRKQKRNPVVLIPKTDPAKCTHCGHCVMLCPVQAITKGDELRTDPSRCIRCCACVKGCKEGARSFPNPYAEPLSKNFAKQKPNLMRI